MRRTAERCDSYPNRRFRADSSAMEQESCTSSTDNPPSETLQFPREPSKQSSTRSSSLWRERRSSLSAAQVALKRFHRLGAVLRGDRTVPLHLWRSRRGGGGADIRALGG